jgi:hypothetical protein
MAATSPFGNPRGLKEWSGELEQVAVDPRTQEPRSMIEKKGNRNMQSSMQSKKKNKNDFILTCIYTPSSVNLYFKIWIGLYYILYENMIKGRWQNYLWIRQKIRISKARLGYV